ncbi:MAG: molybdenum ABC transporter ATP-binding protein [Phycisphaerales bacterium]
MIRADLRLARPGFALDVRFSTDGRVTGIFGPSGAGKSTLIHVIAGLETPDSGELSIDGEVVFDSARRVNVAAHRRRVGVVFQEHRLFPHLSVQANLLYGRARAARRDDEVRAVVELLELGPLLARRATDISGGERQRVALGRAVLSDPRVLLLDEPLASLDLRLKQQIIPYLRRLRDASRVPMLYVSHDLGELLQLTDEFMLIDGGRLVGHGRYRDLVHDEAALAALHDRGMRNVMAARVVRHEPQDGVTVVELDATDGRLREIEVARVDASEGANVVLSVQPADIALAAECVGPVSIRNQLAGVVTRCTLHERGAIVEVDVGSPLIVEISRRSVSTLELAAGKRIVCLIKSHAIRRLDGR